MNKVEITAQLNAKYNEIFPKYWEIIIKKLEEPENQEITKIYNYLNCNIKYLEKYMSLIENSNEEYVKKELEKLNLIKELEDSLFETKQETNIYSNPKIEIVNE